MAIDVSEDDGFTLVELLIAIAIVGLTMSFAVVALSSGRQLLGRLTSDQIYVDDITLLHTIFSQALSQVSARSGSIFLGTPERIQFTAAAPRGLGQTNAIDANFEPTNGDYGVVATWRGQSGSISRIVAKSVRLRFAYFDNRQTWVTVWSIPDTVPGAVKIEVFRGYSSSPYELIVPVRLLDARDCDSKMLARCSGR